MMKLENDLSELRVKGILSEQGFLKETYSEEAGDLIHEFTDKGNFIFKELLRDPKNKEMFLQMAGAEAGRHPELANLIKKRAMELV